MKLSYEGVWKVGWSAVETAIAVEALCRDPVGDPKRLAETLRGFIETAGDRGKAMEKLGALADKFRAIATLL